jgi:hypothetical protein
VSAATILTLANGKGIDLLDPKPEDIDFDAIAQHLAKEKRYNGATPGLEYSVAEHCARGASAILTATGNTTLAAYFLLHDAHEHTLKDDTTPKKRAIAELAPGAFRCPRASTSSKPSSCSNTARTLRSITRPASHGRRSTTRPSPR